MNKQEYLLTVLSEECAEVTQDISKALRFGFDDVNPSKGITNKEAIQNEINDFIGVVTLLTREGFFDEEFIKDDKIEAKIAKVKKWMTYSVNQGCLS